GSLIGRGGMAEVYEGTDTRHGRTVAIKLLKPDLANDPSFEDRFRNEAQASARISHPTIVRVYDAGEDIDTDANGNQIKHPFIIMEFVKGKLLREILHERRLSIEEAVNFASGILTALEFSHKAGVIHRDIKSANVMITENDQVKVMDFGIARAVSESSATMANTVGIMGTAQYFSPEQAKGETVDSRTDLYSTGVILYEMLTGRPPFKGDTAVSVAYQHVSEAVTPPSQFNSNISAELDQVVLHGLAKDRNERFQSAEDFREHLIAAANGSPITLSATPEKSEPKVENVVQTTSWSLDDADSHDAGPATVFAELLNGPATEENEVVEHPIRVEPLPTQVIEPAEIQPSFDDSMPNTNPFAALGVDLSAPVTSSIGSVRSGRPSGGVLWGVGTAVAVVIVGLIAFLGIFGNLNLNITPGSGGIAVVDVVGKTYADGYNALTQENLLVLKVYEPSETIPLDQIISTDPVAGTKVPENTSITVKVSSGAASVLMPELKGMTEAQARQALIDVKLALGTITQENSATVVAGQVTATDPMVGSSVIPGAVVNLVISNGKVMVPDVRNLSVNDARNALTAPAVGLSPVVTTKTTCSGTLGSTVLEQSIPAGLANQKSAITLYVACN
ncbi:MAG: Stk1 family PASTA domain-containing Ser/Thr kinase, partial [Micrococcales bacterium]